MGATRIGGTGVGSAPTTAPQRIHATVAMVRGGVHQKRLPSGQRQLRSDATIYPAGRHMGPSVSLLRLLGECRVPLAEHEQGGRLTLVQPSTPAPPTARFCPLSGAPPPASPRRLYCCPTALASPPGACPPATSTAASLWASEAAEPTGPGLTGCIHKPVGGLSRARLGHPRSSSGSGEPSHRF